MNTGRSIVDTSQRRTREVGTRRWRVTQTWASEYRMVHGRGQGIYEQLRIALSSSNEYSSVTYLNYYSTDSVLQQLSKALIAL